MAKGYISEHINAMSPIGTYAAPVLPQPGVTDQIVSFTGTHGESSAFQANTYAIEICADADCCFVIGSAPVADNTKNMFLGAKTSRIYAVRPGDKISFVTP